MTGLFVTGTDTEVGKTRISLGLIELLQQQGRTVAAMKPVASGCIVTEAGLRNDDACLLQKQANMALPYEVINPYSFEAGIAPHIAAQQQDIEIDIAIISKHFEQIQRNSDVVVVEGAGGWLVPINDKHTMADLAIALNLPVVLVVSLRLGCINHALLSVAAIEQSGLRLFAWVTNEIEAITEADAMIATLKSRIAAPCLGHVPRLRPEQTAAAYLKLDKSSSQK